MVKILGFFTIFFKLKFKKKMVKDISFIENKKNLGAGVKSCSFNDDISFCYENVLGADNSLHC